MKGFIFLILVFGFVSSVQAQSGNYCSTTSDCGSRWEGWKCIDRGDNINVCVSGDSSDNSFCEINSDCGSWGVGNCADRGDGVKICMNNNVSSADDIDHSSEHNYCQSSSDCGNGSIFSNTHQCIDRGDGINVCIEKENIPSMTPNFLIHSLQKSTI